MSHCTRRVKTNIAITRSCGTFFPRMPPSPYPIPTPYYSPVRPREDIHDARFLLRPTWVLSHAKCPPPARLLRLPPSRKMPVFRPPVAALGPQLAPLLAPFVPRRGAVVSPPYPGKMPGFLALQAPRRCPCEEGPTRFSRCPSLFYPFIEGSTPHLLGILEKRE